MQVFAIVVSLAITLVAVALFATAIGQIVATLRIGQPAVGPIRDAKARRWRTMLMETLGHTRMLQWTHVGVLHWFVFVGFGFLFLTLVTAFGQLFDADFALPVIGHWLVYDWATELHHLAHAAVDHRPDRDPAAQSADRRALGRYSRFFGSRMWQGYFVESRDPRASGCASWCCGAASTPSPAAPRGRTTRSRSSSASCSTTRATRRCSNMIYLVAMVKIVISFTWMIVLARNTTMGVAWHRFTAWPNIWFRRNADGRTALGGLQPMMAGGVPIDFENIEDLDEDTAFGVGKVEDFTWKGLLDFTSCTECGRCQSQCPAWNTEKPLSPKLLVMALREHASPRHRRLAAVPGTETSAAGPRAETRSATHRATPTAYGVIDPDVLWSCTSCGACVQQCPVDIEHVDHIMDMRRYQVLVESSFPAELNQLFKGLENKGNPWNMAPSGRMDWAKGLPFEVKQVGVDIESLDGGRVAVLGGLRRRVRGPGQEDDARRGRAAARGRRLVRRAR